MQLFQNCCSCFLLLWICWNNVFIDAKKNRTFLQDLHPRTRVIESNTKYSSVKQVTKLKVMTFNTWLSGNQVKDGLDKIAKHIKLVDPDIVALQEMNEGYTDILLRKLGPHWSRCGNSQGPKSNTNIITTKKVQTTYKSAEGFTHNGCQILINDKPINFWNVHLDYLHHGPYSACLDPKVKTTKELEKCERKSLGGSTRMDSIDTLLKHPSFVQNMLNSHKEPLIIAGDFNTPSHLDWTDEAKHLHCNWHMDWPVSRALGNEGFIDSYRVIYPSPLLHPGNTWSTVVKYHEVGRPALEPQDRIDYIYFKSDKLSVLSSETYSGDKQINIEPNHYKNDWPSDHFAVVTEFTLSEF